jgi:hypothetical protein
MNCDLRRWSSTVAMGRCSGSCGAGRVLHRSGSMSDDWSEMRLPLKSLWFGLPHRATLKRGHLAAHPDVMERALVETTSVSAWLVGN